MLIVLWLIFLFSVVLMFVGIQRRRPTESSERGSVERIGG
jgi:hypothetical protein